MWTWLLQIFCVTICIHFSQQNWCILDCKVIVRILQKLLQMNKCIKSWDAYAHALSMYRIKMSFYKFYLRIVGTVDLGQDTIFVKFHQERKQGEQIENVRIMNSCLVRRQNEALNRSWLKNAFLLDKSWTPTWIFCIIANIVQSWYEGLQTYLCSFAKKICKAHFVFWNF